MNLWHPDDWDGNVPAEVQDQLRALQQAGELNPVALLISPTFDAGRALLAAFGRPGVCDTELVPLLAVPGDRLRDLLDYHVGPGIGHAVMTVRLLDPEAIRGVLILPETIEVYALAPVRGEGTSWSVCILDLAGRRMHLSDGIGAAWFSCDLSFSPAPDQLEERAEV